MATYAEKLKDPRWQKRRLQILERDGWKCAKCGDTETMLTVHHLRYKRDEEPWETADYSLITLCQPCHEEEHEWSRIEPDGVSETLAELGAWWVDRGMFTNVVGAATKRRLTNAEFWAFLRGVDKALRGIQDGDEYGRRLIEENAADPNWWHR